MNDAGIYAIQNANTGRQYIGSACNIRRRWLEHKSYLRRGAHHSRHLQRSWDKNGEAAFTFKVLLICAKKDLLFYEQRALDVLKPAYNISPAAGNTLGVRHTEEFKARRSEIARAQKLSDAHKKALSRVGLKNSAEHNAKIAAALKGRKK